MTKIPIQQDYAVEETEIPVTKSSEHSSHENVSEAELKEKSNKFSKLKNAIGQRKKIVAASLVAAIFISVSGVFLIHTQRPVSFKLASRDEGFPVAEHVKVEFNQALKDVELSVTPEIEGEWNYEINIFGTTGASFKPSNDKLDNATKYTVSLKKAKRVLTKKPIEEKETSFITEFSPGITSVSPMPGSKDVKTDTSLKVVFSEPQNDGGMPALSLVDSDIKLELEVSEDKRIFSWKPKDGFKQTASYEARITKGNGENLVSIDFETVKQPNITAATNKTHFYPEEKIEVAFDIPMNIESPALICECEGEGEWESSQKFVFSPIKIEPAKRYTYKVPKGLKSKAGGAREEERAYAIETPGVVTATISGSRSAALQTNITVAFDQPVKRDTVKARLSVEPNATSKLTWKDDKTAIVQLSGLDYQTTYTLKIVSGVEPQKFGLASTAVLSGTTTTIAQTIKLNVPQYKQSHRLSCEESALRMALAYRGVHASDMEILHRVGYNPRSHDAGPNSWDNPYEMYVGDVNGSQAGKTGYGVYAPPIAKAARSYGRGASVAYGVSANYLAQAIHDGNPVVIWGSSLSGARMDWNTSSGPVGAWVGQHARTLVGVVGKPSAPIGFYVNDPLYGNQKYWSASALMAHMNQYGNLSNQAVVIQ